MDKITYQTIKTRHPRKPVLYWVAYDVQGHEIGRNNSIALLRWQVGGKCIIKSVR